MKLERVINTICEEPVFPGPMSYRLWFKLIYAAIFYPAAYQRTAVKLTKQKILLRIIQDWEEV